MKQYNLIHEKNGIIGKFTLDGDKKTVELIDGLDGWLDKPADWYYEYLRGQRVFTGRDVDRFINDRVFPSNRQTIDGILKSLGMTEYDALEIFLKTSGKHVNDPFYIEEIKK